jgi:hypothetical protein
VPGSRPARKTAGGGDSGLLNQPLMQKNFGAPALMGRGIHRTLQNIVGSRRKLTDPG